MGSCGSGSPDGGIGPIVWVRRRNGSWWPGKILEADELSDSNNLTSPRTGTPVKLLGREDASVDWYNLEKSKRVKAFRCGEFDDCIEKAEAAQGMPIKKREKYARREDAIIHALELERQLLGKQGKLGASDDNLRRMPSAPEMENELDHVSNGVANESANAGDTKSSLERAETNIKEEVVTGPKESLNSKNESEPIRDDDHSEETPRMRGLQDFGLRTASLKRKLSSSAESDSTSEKLSSEHFSEVPPNGGPSTDANVSGIEQVGSIFRAKRSKYAYLPAETGDSLDVKGFMRNHFQLSSTQLKDKHHQPLPGTLRGENSSSGLVEDNDSDSTDSDSSDSDSDSSATEPDIDGDFTGALRPRHGERNTAGQLVVLAEHGATSSEDLDESGNSIEVSHLYPDDPFLTNEAVSKWQLKGKRNTRPLKNKSVYKSGGNDSNRLRNGRYSQMTGSMYGFDYDDLEERHFGSQTEWLGDGGNTHQHRFASRGRAKAGRTLDLEDVSWEDRPAFRGHWDDRGERFAPVFGDRNYFSVRKMPMLLDVDLKVRKSYQKEPVPIVSLTSKLNGRAIIGYPVQIKVLQEGLTDSLGSLNDDYSNNAVDHDDNLILPPAWKTARRTNFRVPRPHLSSVLGSDDGAEDFPFTGQDRLFTKPGLGNLSHKTSPARKSILQNSRSSEKSTHKKLPKRGILSSNQKIRTLSSIAIQQNFGGKSIYEADDGKMGGVMKPEISAPTTVACIPVKLAFSRLLEKINRPPSKAHSEVVVSDGDAGKKTA